MQELRFDTADGVASDLRFRSNRKAMLLVAGDKSGGSEKRFYRQLIETADKRFDVHVARIKRQKEREQKERKLRP
jgi:hypothetical protein